GSGPTNALREDALRALIAHEHLVSEVVPDLLVDPRELRLEPDFGDVPRPRQIDAIHALHGARSGGDDDNAVGERDRLLEASRRSMPRKRGPVATLSSTLFHGKTASAWKT